ncbi:ABC transporter permease subunit [Bacillus infantis]|uniref:ABC transporter permease subunit n=1 Tax=Bacillus infantis TaxID=324767 RepID=UPI0020A10B7E|nr:ABC transporter permease subunit [Bacillus infantis]MCP1158957.1 ABC transporter permease subunit [Bacillus infantis]
MATIFRSLTSVVLIIILASLPLGFHNGDAKVVFSIIPMIDEIRDFIQGLKSGESWLYLQGERERPLLEDLIPYWLSSFLYLTVSAVIAVILSVLFGVFLWKKGGRLLNAVLGFTGMLPDFILVLLLQLLTVFVHKETGIKTVKVASSSMSEPAIFLPIFTLVIIPLFYLLRSLSERSHEVKGEDYILAAKAKGLRKGSIYLFHVFLNVLPFLKADLHKILSIMLGNLFIIEYLYNTRGITALLFVQQIQFGYQYNLVIFSLLSLLLLYLVSLYTLKLLLWLIERGLQR